MIAPHVIDHVELNAPRNIGLPMLALTERCAAERRLGFLRVHVDEAPEEIDVRDDTERGSAVENVGHVEVVGIVPGDNVGISFDDVLRPRLQELPLVCVRDDACADDRQARVEDVHVPIDRRVAAVLGQDRCDLNMNMLLRGRESKESNNCEKTNSL